MAQPVNTYDTYAGAKAIREDLQNVIYLISPTDTPFLSMAAQGDATNTLHEWLTDALDTPDGTNARIEGEDKDAQSITPPTRLNNYTQISDKTVVISGTERKVNSVGSGDEWGRQIAKKGLSLKRDMETILTGNQASVAGDSATARKLRSLESWYPAANTNNGANYVAGTTTTAATDGVQRTIRETYLKDVLQKVWTAGGLPDTIIAGATNKQRISGFGGNANRQIQADEKKLIAAIDVYVSDFGTLKIVADRFSRARTVHVLQSDMVGVDYLRRMDDEELAKTGDNDKRLLNCEYTLKMNNPNAHGAVTDVTT